MKNGVAETASLRFFNCELYMVDSYLCVNIVKMSVDLVLNKKRLTWGISRRTVTSMLALELTMGQKGYETKAFCVLNWLPLF